MRQKLVVCIGAALIDESFHFEMQPVTGTSNPSTFCRSPGGVARNIANHLALLGNSVELITHFGNDSDGKWLMKNCISCGIGISHSLVNETDTGRYVAMLSPEGDLFAGAVSTQFESLITPAFLQKRIPLLKRASLILMDCNLSSESLDWLLRFCLNENLQCIIEPVSVPKAARLQNTNLDNVLLITPNRDEMSAISSEKDQLQLEILVQHLLKRGVKYLWVRNGKEGSVTYEKDYNFKLDAPIVHVKDTTGAGDAALAGWIHARLTDKNLEDCVRYGHALASLILQENGAIKNNLTSSLLEDRFIKEKFTI